MNKRYKIEPKGKGLAVIDTWSGRQIMATYGGSLRDRRQSTKQTAARAERNAQYRVARLRRIILASGGVARRLADRIARDLDIAGIGRWDSLFS